MKLPQSPAEQRAARAARQARYREGQRQKEKQNAAVDDALGRDEWKSGPRLAAELAAWKVAHPYPLGLTDEQASKWAKDTEHEPELASQEEAIESIKAWLERQP